MVKGIVKTNKANDTKYIYLPKDCGFGDGQEVDIKFDGIGIYDKKRLEEYFKKNKKLLLDIKKKIIEIRKEVWQDKFFKYGGIIGKYLDYGKLEWDEEIYFEKNNEYSACPDGDIDGGELSCFDFRVDDFEEFVKKKKINKEKGRKELIDFLSILFLQKKAEELIEEQHRREVDMLEEFGFENKEDKRYTGMETTLYSNGIVQLWYDSEAFSYDQILNLSTMREIDVSNKEENLVF